MRLTLALTGLLMIASAAHGFTAGDPAVDARATDASILVDPAAFPESRDEQMLLPDVPGPMQFRSGELLYIGPHADALQFAGLVGGEAVSPLADLAQGRGCLPAPMGCDWDAGELTIDDFSASRVLVPGDAQWNQEALGALGARDAAAALAQRSAPFHYQATFSSPEALALVGLAAAAANAGYPVDVNWIGEPAGYPDGNIVEAASGPSGYASNVAQWPHFRASPGSEPDIGTFPAWQLLHKTGYLQSQASDPWMVFLDANYRSVDPQTETIDWNYPEYPSGFGMYTLDGSWIKYGGGGSINWHGDYVAKVGTARPNNGMGIAGPGGPTAIPVYIQMDYSLSRTLQALDVAVSWGARLASLSYGYYTGAVQGGDSTADAYNDAFQGYRDSGLLVIAAAHNHQRNLDASACALKPVIVNGLPTLKNVCTEVRNMIPCEFQAVLCIGGTDPMSKDPHLPGGGFLGTNYGFPNAPGGSVISTGYPGTVDLFAPFKQYHSGSDLSNVGWATGTSGATPMTAGVANLLVANQAAISAGWVEKRLLDEAHEHTGSFPEGTKKILTLNALDSVRAQVCRWILLAEIDQDYGVYSSFLPVHLSVSITSGHGPFTVVWASSLDGVLGTGYSIDPYLSPGTHTITAQVTDVCGLRTLQDSVTVHVSSARPAGSG